MKYLDIKEVPSIDQSNYYLVDFRKLVEEHKDIVGFGGLVNELWETGRTFEKAIYDGVSADLTGNIQTYYIEILMWLKGSQATVNWIPVQPLNSTDVADNQNKVSTIINSWMPSYRSTFFGNPLLAGYFANYKNAKRLPASKALEQYAQELEQTTLERIQKDFDEKQIKLNELHDLQIQSYERAVAFKKWQEYYDELLSGKFDKRTDRLFKRKFKSGSSYYELMEHFDAWRTIWLYAFVIGLGLSVLLTALLGWTLSGNLAEIVSLKLAVALLFGIPYVSANKNYRIYGNLYDQTRQRSVAAKTIQGILLDERFGEEEKRILLAVAAQSLFEMKPNGHLTKKESASPVSELLTTVLSRQS